MQSKEYELTRAALNYAVMCLKDGDWAVLRDLGLGEPEARALEDLALGELALLAERLTGHVLNMQFDRDALWLMLAQAQQERASARLKTELVRRDAPAEMMTALFGTSAREYTAMRRALRRPRCAGRPRDADTEQMETIWRAWQRMGHRAADSMPARPDEWRALADATDIDLRTIWRFFQQTAQMGLPS